MFSVSCFEYIEIEIKTIHALLLDPGWCYVAITADCANNILEGKLFASVNII